MAASGASDAAGAAATRSTLLVLRLAAMLGAGGGASAPAVLWVVATAVGERLAMVIRAAMAFLMYNVRITRLLLRIQARVHTRHCHRTSCLLESKCRGVAGWRLDFRVCR
jgi:hypothetical protein